MTRCTSPWLIHHRFPLPAPAEHLSARSPTGPRGLAPPARRPPRAALLNHLGALNPTNVVGGDHIPTPATSAGATLSP